MFEPKRKANRSGTFPQAFWGTENGEQSGVLAVARSVSYTPGTNVKGEVSGANWTFMLPSMELDHVVCLGVPPEDVIPVLARVGRRVTLLCSLHQQVDVGGLRLRYQPLSLRPLVLDAWNKLPLEDHTVDLLVFTDRKVLEQFMRHADWFDEVQRVLKPDGLVYFEFGSWKLRLFNRFRSHPGTLRHFWITPLVGRMKTAVPSSDTAVERFCVRNALCATHLKRRPLASFERALYEKAYVRARMRRFSALWTPAENATWLDGPPAYLCRLAEAEGVDIAKHRWALVATGDYSSRKILFYLFPPDAQGQTLQPEYLVKLTRAPQFNYRLENEVHALRALQHAKVPGAHVLPRIVFSGHHSGLALAAQTAVPGEPFNRRTEATPDCPYARAAVNWLVDLGQATVNTEEATAAEVAQILESLVTRLADIYRLTPQHLAFLEQQLAVLAASSQPFPLVFQHGDPGPWNVLVRPDGTPVFIDWEAAEPLGMPLWDIWYFWRSFSVRVARKKGVRDRLEAFLQEFLSASELSIRIVASVRRYCEQVGVPREWVSPLFYLCWAHRALKEATRLSSHRLERGHYINLLRLCIDQRNMPTLRRMFLEQ